MIAGQMGGQLSSTPISPQTAYESGPASDRGEWCSGLHRYQRANVSLADMPRSVIRVTSDRSDDRTSISSYPPEIGCNCRLGYVITCCSCRVVHLFEPRAGLWSRSAEGQSVRCRAGYGCRIWLAVALASRGGALNVRARREDQARRAAVASVLDSSKARPLASTAQARRASLLAGPRFLSYPSYPFYRTYDLKRISPN